MRSSCYEGRLTVRGYNNTAPVGVTITNNHFGNGGESDGVQLIGGAYGVQVGPGNEFTGIKQGSYSAHVDPIQLYGTTPHGDHRATTSTATRPGSWRATATDHALITHNVFHHRRRVSRSDRDRRRLQLT